MSFEDKQYKMQRFSGNTIVCKRWY